MIEASARQVKERIWKHEALEPTVNQWTTKEKQIWRYLKFWRRSYKDRKKMYQLSIVWAICCVDADISVCKIYQSAVEYMRSILAYLVWLEISTKNKFKKRTYYYSEKRKLIPELRIIISDSDKTCLEIAWDHLYECNSKWLRPNYKDVLFCNEDDNARSQNIYLI